MKLDIAAIRRDYSLRTLGENDVAKDPFLQFSKWWDEALASEIEEVNAMTLATATKTGLPSARIVLLKSFDENGFVFFTNYTSRKGSQLESNPQAALVFFWKELERQVRIEGTVEKTEAEESDTYFLSRPAGSRLGAWASPQSKVIADRRQLEENVARYTREFGADIPRPAFWGGYLVRPSGIEFWQGRSNRLHDRIHYRKTEDGNWVIERLAP
jgi:pyridoxamine 5'-phosphate oxidase